MSHYPSVIARPAPGGFSGRQVHTAGPPDYVLGLLTRLYHNAFNRDLDAMQAFLVDDHPGGWSRLGDDPTVDTGWKNDNQFNRDGFVCYCHGDRDQHSDPFTADSDPTFVDWLYVLAPTGITVHRLDWGDDDGLDDYDDTPPVWQVTQHVAWVANAGPDDSVERGAM